MVQIEKMHTWHFALSPFNVIKGENTFILKIHLRVTGEKRICSPCNFCMELNMANKNVYIGYISFSEIGIYYFLGAT